MRVKNSIALSALALSKLSLGHPTRRDTVIPMQSNFIPTPKDSPVFEHTTQNGATFNLHNRPTFMAHIMGDEMNCLVIPDMGTPQIACAKGDATGAITLGELDINGNQYFNLGIYTQNGESLSANMVMKPEGLVNPQYKNFKVIQDSDGKGYEIDYIPPSKTSEPTSTATSPTSTATSPTSTAPTGLSTVTATVDTPPPSSSPSEDSSSVKSMSKWLAGGALLLTTLAVAA